MKHFTLKTILILSASILLNNGVDAQFLSYFDTVASYTLVHDASDITGMQPDAELINVPFADTNGVYCNGVYVHSGNPDGSLVTTKHFDALYGPAFAVSVQFRFDTMPGKSVPVLTCGNGWRYLGLLIRYDGVVLYNFNNLWYDVPDLQIMDDRWHTFVCIYTASDSTAQFWLDRKLLATETGSLIRDDQDGNVSNTDYGAGWTFQGYLRNLTVMASDDLLSGSASAGALQDAVLYPNPAGNFLFTNMANHASWEIFDDMGRCVRTGTTGPEQSIDISLLSPGSYVFHATENGNGTSHAGVFVKTNPN